MINILNRRGNVASTFMDYPPTPGRREREISLELRHGVASAQDISDFAASLAAENVPPHAQIRVYEDPNDHHLELSCNWHEDLPL